MSEWKVSDRLAAFVAERLDDVGGATFRATRYPSIIWSTGGTVTRPGAPPEALPPRYALGWVDRANIARFRSIPDRRFGRLVFHPRPEDEQSSRRLIDFDGSDIVVR